MERDGAEVRFAQAKVAGILAQRRLSVFMSYLLIKYYCFQLSAFEDNGEMIQEHCPYTYSTYIHINTYIYLLVYSLLIKGTILLIKSKKKIEFLYVLVGTEITL